MNLVGYGTRQSDSSKYIRNAILHTKILNLLQTKIRKEKSLTDPGSRDFKNHDPDFKTSHSGKFL